MNKVRIGKVVSTHGIKGEIKILSDFPYKEKVFQIGKEIIMEDSPYIIKSYRIHKGYDMVTLNDYQNINEVLFLLKKEVYFDQNQLDLSETEVLDEELIHYQVLTKEGKKGIIKEIFMASPKNKIIRVEFEKEVLIPFHSPMIIKIEKEKKELIVDIME